MKIYRIAMHDKELAEHLIEVDVEKVSFAHFSALGTWSKGKGLCKRCNASTQTYIEPLLVQWEPSTDVIGDFSWDGPWGYIFVVIEHVATFLRRNKFECKFLNVEYVEPEKSAKRWSCVPFPYRGPEQYWAKCETLIDLDLEASNVQIKDDCPECGVKRYTFRNDGIVIPQSNWHGEKMFRITTNGKSLATFVTAEGRRLIEVSWFSVNWNLSSLALVS